MSAPAFDLQSHSTVSDGSLAPAAVVAAAAAAGVALLALTDHDSVDGVEEALAAGREHGVRIVTGVELSALDTVHEDLHVCGYGFDHRDTALAAALAAFREDRNVRGRRMAQALRDDGLALADGPLAARDEAGAPIGRPHLAAAVLAHPANAARLAAEGLADPGAVIEAYLVPGAPGYRPRSTPTVTEAIAVIHAAGGAAIWAHPFWDVSDEAGVLATVDRFAGLGVDGVECFYATHTEHQTRVVAEHCAARGLLRTGSADFHGPDHTRFARFRAFSTYGLQPDLGPIAG